MSSQLRKIADIAAVLYWSDNLIGQSESQRMHAALVNCGVKELLWCVVTSRALDEAILSLVQVMNRMDERSENHPTAAEYSKAKQDLHARRNEFRAALAAYDAKVR